MLFAVLSAKILLPRIYGSWTNGLSSSGYFVISKNVCRSCYSFFTQEEVQDAVVGLQ